VTKTKSCPCCGNKKLYSGPLASCVMGVKCPSYHGGCGLELGRTYQERMPRRVRTLKQYDAHLLEQAIAAWNRRKSNGELKS